MKWGLLFKILIPVIVPILVGFWKIFLSKLPPWAYPLLAAFLGGFITILQAFISEISPGTEEIVIGSLLGLAGSGLYDIKKKTIG